MKTQLLEDIGQSAPSSLTPSKPVGNVKPGDRASSVSPAGNAQLAQIAEPGSAFSAWKRQPGAERRSFTQQQPGGAPAPLKLESLFEEIAALEAQYVPPPQQHEPAIAAVESWRAAPDFTAEPTQDHAVPGAELMYGPATLRAEPTFSLEPSHSATAPQDPLFDLTPPAPPPRTAHPFGAGPTEAAQSRPRYLLWGACLLSAALLVQGARWVSHERSPALSATKAKATLTVDNPMNLQTLAKQVTSEPDADVRATPVVAAASPLAAVPPLVLLKPDPPAVAKVDRHAPVASPTPRKLPLKLQQALEPEHPPKLEHRVKLANPPKLELPSKLQHPPKRQHLVEKRPAFRLATPPGRMLREQSSARAEPARIWTEREPVRQFTRGSAIEGGRPTEPDFATERDYQTERERDFATERELARAATLSACRVHGYNAAECVERACSVSRYGFSCRGH